jgi:hypothetical protein
MYSSYYHEVYCVVLMITAKKDFFSEVYTRQSYDLSCGQCLKIQVTNGTDSRSLKIQRIKGEDCQMEQICPSLLLNKKKFLGASSGIET